MKLLDKQHRIAWLLAGLAFAVRAVYLLELSRDPTFSVPIVDEKWHWEWAHAILDGPVLGEGAWFRAPLYPYFLALPAWITDSSVFWSKLLQSVLSIGTTLFIYRIGLNLFGRTVAIISGAAYALYGVLVFYETSFLIPVIFLFFICWAMARLLEHRDSTRPLDWILTGILFGLAAISRPNILLVMPLLAIWLWWEHRDKMPLKRLLLPVSLAVGVCLVVFSVTARNYAKTDEFILISSQGGVNLYLGNNPVADGLTMLMPDVDLDESVSWRQFQSVTENAAESEMGRPLSPAQESSYWSDKAFDFILSHPGDFISLVWRKTVYLLSGFENSDNADIYYQRNYSVLYSLLVWDGPVAFPFGLLLPLAIVGFVLTRADRRRLLPVYLFIIGYIPSIVLFLVTARHRLPLVPFLIVLAAAGVVRAIALVREKRLKPVLPVTAVAVAALVLCNMTWYDIGRASEFQIYFNNGLRYEKIGDWRAAEREYEKAYREFPQSASIANNLGHARLQLGKTEEAITDFRTAIRLNQAYGPAYTNLGMVYHRREQYDTALTLYRLSMERSTTVDSVNLAQTHENMALLFAQVEQLDSAALHWQQAIAYAPDDASRYFGASVFFSRTGRFDESDRLWRQGRSLSEPDASAHFNRGLSLIQARRFTEAIAPLQNAVAQQPDFFQAHHLLAAGFLESDGPVDSVRVHLKQCLDLAPDYRPANVMLNHLQQQGISIY